MTVYIKDHISWCNQCAHMKGSNKALTGSLLPLPIPDGSWQDISTDFTTDLPLSNGFDSILIVIDQFSKETVFISCNKTAMVLDTAKLNLHHIWKNHRLPQLIVSDCGLQFASQVMQDVANTLELYLSYPLHTTHKQTGRQNEWTEISSSISVCSVQKNKTSGQIGYQSHNSRIIQKSWHLLRSFHLKSLIPMFLEWELSNASPKHQPL